MEVEVLNIYTEHFKKDSYDLILIIDTLRAGTTIAKALSNGALAVYPVAEVDKAFELKKKIPSAVLAGERKSFKIEGFDLGNSPRHFTENTVKGKNVVLTTSNGTQAVERFKGHGPIISMALSNYKAVVDYSKDFERVLIVCAGSHGEMALEDVYTAGKYVSELEMPALNDAAFVAKCIAKEEEIKILKSSQHGRYLSQIGMGEDLIDACEQIKIVPILKKDPFEMYFFGGE